MEHERTNSAASFEAAPDTEKPRTEYRTIGGKAMQIVAEAGNSATEKSEQKPAPAKTSHLGNVFIGDLTVPVKDPMPIALKMSDFTDLYRGGAENRARYEKGGRVAAKV